MSLLLLFGAGAGPPSATTEPLSQVLLETNSGAFVDISTDLRNGNTMRGRSQELDRYAAGRASLSLSNGDRIYDPTYAAGPYYGNLKPMRQLKVRAAYDTVTSLRVPGVSGSSASTPDSASLSITGDLDVRARISLDDWTPSSIVAAVSKWSNTGNQRSWALRVNNSTAGTLQLIWSTDGTATINVVSTVVVPFTDTQKGWIRATLDVDDGAGNRVVKFYTSAEDLDDPDEVTWTQLGTTSTTAGTTSIFDGTATVMVGDTNDGDRTITGNVYYAEVRNGIDGAVVASPDFDARHGQYTSTTTLVDGQGNTWTRNGSATFAAVATGYDLFTGFVDRWSDSPNGPHDAVAQVDATDGFKVLNRATLPSSAYAVEVAADSPAAWYRLGDSPDATSLTDSVGVFDLTTINGTPILGASGLVARDDDTAAEFDATTDGAQADGDLPVMTAPCAIECIISTTTTPVTVALFGAQVTYALGTGINIGMNNTGNVLFEVSSTAGAAVQATSTVTVNDGDPHHVVGVWNADATMKIYVDGADVTSGSPTATVGTFDFPRGTIVVGSGTVGGSTIPTFVGTLDEVAFYDTALTAARILAHYQARATAWSGDLPGARITRILDAIGWPADLRDLDTGTTVLQGAELGISALEHIQKVTESEFGLVYMTADGKVRFEQRAATINQTVRGTFGNSTGEIGYRELTPDYSDTHIRNVVTVSRLDGVAQTATDQDSVDEFQIQGFTLDGLYHSSDSQSLEAANYILSQYKQPFRRVTSLTVGPPKVGAESLSYPQMLGRELSDWVTVLDRPQQVGDPIEQTTVIEQVAHQFGPKTWVTTWAMSPANTNTYGVWDDPNSLWDQALWFF